MLKIRRPLGRLIFNMGIAIPGKTVFLIETAPWELSQYKDHLTSIRIPIIKITPSCDHFSFVIRIPISGKTIFELRQGPNLALIHGYCQTSSISSTKFQNFKMCLISSCSCLCPMHWSQVLSWEWRCSWSSADRRCSNYIWVINNFIAY